MGPPEVCAGGISDSRGLAMALAMGASAVWGGTRFVASEEGGIDAAARRARRALRVDPRAALVPRRGPP